MTGPTLLVRHADEGDVAFLCQDGYLPESAIRRKVAEGDAFVAARDGIPVGYLRLERLWSKLPYIELVRVMEPHRRSGVGRALLAFVEAEAAARGCAALYSSSQANEPEPQAWHRRMGFVECGILNGVNEGGVGELFLRKILTPNTGANAPGAPRS